MKSKILIITIISFLTYQTSFAAGACLIKDKSAPVLLEYIKNNRTIIKNITNGITETQNNTKKEKSSFFKDTAEDFDKKYEESASIFNEIFNFRGYYSYFKYFVTYPLFNEVPSQVRRDYTVLDNEGKGMLEYLKTINRNGTSDIIIKDACKGITKGLEKCKKELNNKKTIKIIGRLIKNNDSILDLYRNSVMGNNVDNIDLILVDEPFKNDIQNKYYSQQAISKCSETDGFLKQITDSIKNIKLLNKQGTDGIQKWKDAIDLMLGNSPDKEAEIEKRKLKEYLNDSGIPSDKQAIIMKNLKETNSNGFSFNNNFITNSYNATKKKLLKDIEAWKKEYIGDAYPKDKKEFSIKNINAITETSETTRSIQLKINELYENELPFLGVGNIKTETLRAKIINSHNNIQKSIEILEDTLIISKKVCNSQGGGGNCN